MLEPHTPSVYVESPPSNDLPRQSDFNRVAIEMSDTTKQRVIYLRPGDTIFLEVEQHYIIVLAMDTKSTEAIGVPQGELSASSNDVQVESSVQQQNARTEITAGAPENEEDTEDDDDDLDVPFATPSGVEDVTSDTIGGPAINETPLKTSRDDDHVISTAPDLENTQHATESANDPDTRDDAESNIFRLSKGGKPPTTYHRTPKQKRQIVTDGEIMESSDARGMSSELLGEDDAAIEDGRGETHSSPPKRKHSMTEDDEEDGAIPASTAPPLKRSRGRPTNASRAANTAAKNAPTKTGKPRGRPSNASKAAQQAEDASSPGKLRMPTSSRKSGAHKVYEEEEEEEDDDNNSDHEEDVPAKQRRKHGQSPDLDPRSSATPQSPGTPMTGKLPTKVLLSNSKYAKDTKAKKWLSRHGVAISDDIPGKRANFFCVVGNGELATTAKVLCSLALGKRVVADQWIEDSMKDDRFLDLDDYIHDDLAETAGIDRGELFKKMTLFITDAQMKAYGDGIGDIKGLATAVGAWKVESGSVKKGSSMPAAGTIFLGGDCNDQDALSLTKAGQIVYQKALLTQSIIKGELLVDDEGLKWQPTPEKAKKGKK
jgi:hypothetical protein